MLAGARNGFNEMRHLTMLWTVWRHWPEKLRFTFNCYKNLAQILLRQTWTPLVTLMSKEGVTQGDPLSVVLYGVTLVPLVEELWEADPGILTPLYVDDAAFEGSSRRSAHMLKLLMKRVRTRGNSLNWPS